jgi:hypothetical protein
VLLPVRYRNQREADPTATATDALAPTGWVQLGSHRTHAFRDADIAVRNRRRPMGQQRRRPQRPHAAVR